MHFLNLDSNSIYVPEVSIILPVYNVEKFVSECLDSIADQSFTKFEIIAVNDGSTDNSLEILNGYQSKSGKLKIITQINKGLSSARNTGLKNASGKYVLFCDSDDIIDKGLLEQCYCLAENNKTDVVKFEIKTFTDTLPYANQCSKLRPIEEKVYAGKEFIKLIAYADSSWMTVPAYFFKRKFLLNTGILFKEGLIHEDVLFSPQVLWHAQKVGYTSKVLYHYRLRAGSITQNLNYARSIDSHITICNELYKFTKKQSADRVEKDILYKYVFTRYLYLFDLIKSSGISISGEKLKSAVFDFISKKNVRKFYSCEEQIRLAVTVLVPVIYPSLHLAKKYFFNPVRLLVKYQIIKRLSKS